MNFNYYKNYASDSSITTFNGNDKTISSVFTHDKKGYDNDVKIALDKIDSKQESLLDIKGKNSNTNSSEVNIKNDLNNFEYILEQTYLYLISNDNNIKRKIMISDIDFGKSSFNSFNKKLTIDNNVNHHSTVNKNLDNYNNLYELYDLYLDSYENKDDREDTSELENKIKEPNKEEKQESKEIQAFKDKENNDINDNNDNEYNKRKINKLFGSSLEYHFPNTPKERFINVLKNINNKTFFLIMTLIALQESFLYLTSLEVKNYNNDIHLLFYVFAVLTILLTLMIIRLMDVRVFGRKGTLFLILSLIFIFILIKKISLLFNFINNIRQFSIYCYLLSNP